MMTTADAIISAELLLKHGIVYSILQLDSYLMLAVLLNIIVHESVILDWFGDINE